MREGNVFTGVCLLTGWSTRDLWSKVFSRGIPLSWLGRPGQDWVSPSQDRGTPPARTGVPPPPPPTGERVLATRWAVRLLPSRSGTFLLIAGLTMKKSEVVPPTYFTLNFSRFSIDIIYSYSENLEVKKQHKNNLNF